MVEGQEENPFHDPRKEEIACPDRLDEEQREHACPKRKEGKEGKTSMGQRYKDGEKGEEEEGLTEEDVETR